MEHEFRFISGCSASLRSLLHQQCLSMYWDHQQNVMIIECQSPLQERALEIMQGASQLRFVTVTKVD